MAVGYSEKVFIFSLIMLDLYSSRTYNKRIIEVLSRLNSYI